MNVEQQQLRRDRAALVAELEQAGATVRGTEVKCPYHDDRHASGSVWQDSEGVWRYKCHACDASGDVFDLQSRNSGRAVGEILKGNRRPAERVFPTLGDLRIAVAHGGQIESARLRRRPSRFPAANTGREGVPPSPPGSWWLAHAGTREAVADLRPNGYRAGRADRRRRRREVCGRNECPWHLYHHGTMRGRQGWICGLATTGGQAGGPMARLR